MFDELTKRELQVLELIAHGYSADDIQKKFGISFTLSQAHRSFAKRLGSENLIWEELRN